MPEPTFRQAEYDERGKALSIPKAEMRVDGKRTVIVQDGNVFGEPSTGFQFLGTVDDVFGKKATKATSKEKD